MFPHFQCSNQIIMKKDRVLITGANGQIGTVLTEKLAEKHGYDYVLATDIRPPNQKDWLFETLDVLDRDRLRSLVEKYNIREIYHLAAILSAKGEQNPKMAWDINMNGWFNILEVAREFQLKVFFPSSIAVFGQDTPSVKTPQFTDTHPDTVYGISKVAGENWAQYYYKRYGIDVRSVRYPGIIGYQSLPGGGTTDYAVEIFHAAVKGEAFECFLAKDTRLPMMYMEDAIDATIQIMEAPEDQIKIRSSYNLAGINFSPAEITAAIRKYHPTFVVTYQPDFRQDIAASWSESIDDSAARNDWGWQPQYDLAAITKDMLFQLEKQLKPINFPA